MSYLFNENPLVVDRELAVVIGLNEAMVLQQMQYWLKKSDHIHENKAWIYNSVSQWKEQFSFFSESTINRAIKTLETKGLLFIGYYNRDKRDRTRWYSINYEELNAVMNNAKVKMTDAFSQIDQMHLVKMNNAIYIKPETTTETTTEKEKEKKEKFDFEPSDHFLESPELELTCPSPSPAEEDPSNTDKVVQVIERLNLKTGKRYRPDSGFKKLINARFKEDYTLEQFFDVIDKKVEEWTGAKFAMYLRPSTLFGSKFAEYIEQPWPDKYRRFVNTGQISEVGAHNARVIEERRNARRQAQQRQQ
jgi:uncharacterized phage protein (TIGR02220 family)